MKHKTLNQTSHSSGPQNVYSGRYAWHILLALATTLSIAVSAAERISGEVAVNIAAIALVAFMMFVPLGLILLVGFTLRSREGAWGALSRATDQVFLALSGSFLVLTHVLVWDYGPLDGRRFAYETHKSVTEVIVLVAIWVLVAMVSVDLNRIVVLSQAFGLAAIVFLAGSILERASDDEMYWHSTHSVTWESLFHLSDERNVILLTLDAISADEIVNFLEGPEAEDADWLTGFTFFDDIVSPTHVTNFVMPTILAGQRMSLSDAGTPSPQALRRAYDESSSLFAVAHANGFVVEAYPYARNSVHLDPRHVHNLRPIETTGGAASNSMRTLAASIVFALSPQFLKNVYQLEIALYFWSLSSPRTEVTEPISTQSEHAEDASVEGLPASLLAHLDFENAVVQGLQNPVAHEGTAPLFRYLHRHGGHRPLFHDELLRASLPNRDDLRGSYRQQSIGSFVHFVSATVEGLQQIGALDSSLVVILSDHGQFVPRSQDLEVSQRPLISEVAQQSNNPFVMIRWPESNGKIAFSEASLEFDAIYSMIYEHLQTPDCVSKKCTSLATTSERKAYLRVPGQGNPDFKSGGYLEFHVTGHARNPDNWQLTSGMQVIGEGEVFLDPETLMRQVDLAVSFAIGRSFVPER